MDTMDAHAATIAAQAKAIADFTATNATLVAALVAKATRTVTPPPGFTAAGAGTGHTVNLAGVACPMNKFRGRTAWVVPQHCVICSKADQ